MNGVRGTGAGTGADATSVVALFESWVDRTPDAVAVVDDVEWTYRDLAVLVQAIEELLRDHDVRAGSIVGVHLPRSAVLIASALAVLRCDAVYFPLDVAFPHEYVDSLVRDSGARVVVTTTERHVVRLASLEVDIRDEAPSAPWLPGTSEDTSGYLVHTSGSTGAPKGALVPMGVLVDYVHWHRENLTWWPGIRMAQTAPICFDVSIQEMMAGVALGKRLVIAPEGLRARPEDFVQWLGDNQIAQLLLPNLLLEAVAEAAVHLGAALPALVDLVQAGERLTLSPAVRALLAAEPKRVLRNNYGATEMQDVTSHAVGEADIASAGPCPIGSAIGGHRVHVLDDSLCEVPDGVVGELYVAGRLAHGYLGRSALTAAGFVADPFAADGTRMYRTGDLARRDVRGQLLHAGRADHQVKISGARVALSEVEMTLLEHPDVARAAVVAEAGPDGLTTLAAFVVSAREDTRSLREHLAAKLPAHAIPTAMSVVDALPLTQSGKVDRSALRPDDGVFHLGGGNSRERAVLEVFAEVLAVPEIGLDDSFVALGGSSVLAIAAERAARRRGIRLPAGDLIRLQTSRKLAAVVDFDITPVQFGIEDQGDPYGLSLSPDELELIARTVRSGE